MSEADAHGTDSSGTALERSREEVLSAARPLPADEEALMVDLSEAEDRWFITVIFGA